MFSRHRDFEDYVDEYVEDSGIPLWAWFLILPGVVLVSVLLLRRLRDQAGMTEAQPTPAQEFRLEGSRRGGMAQGRQPQQSEISQFAAEAEDTGEIARPVDRSAVMAAGEQSADVAEAANSTVPEETQVAENATQVGDDLKIIEGIGPKIEAILKDAGIINFRMLAETSVERLYKVLQDANLNMADPGTWPEQARLAANENWDFLKALQDRTKAGRRSIED